MKKKPPNFKIKKKGFKCNLRVFGCAHSKSDNHILKFKLSASKLANFGKKANQFKNKIKGFERIPGVFRCAESESCNQISKFKMAALKLADFPTKNVPNFIIQKKRLQMHV